jgi:Ribosomal protein L21e
LSEILLDAEFLKCLTHSVTERVRAICSRGVSKVHIVFVLSGAFLVQQVLELDFPRIEHGPVKISTFLIPYRIGDIVDIKANAAQQKGMPHKFYHGSV